MRAIDTNVVVRFLTGDDPAQAARARRLIEAGEIFVATSVLLESEWVLRSGYGFATERIVPALREFAGLPGVTLEDPLLAARPRAGLGEAGARFRRCAASRPGRGLHRLHELRPATRQGGGPPVGHQGHRALSVSAEARPADSPGGGEARRPEKSFRFRLLFR